MIDHNGKIFVIGLGEVDFPVAVAFGKTPNIIGFDIAKKRVRELDDYRVNVQVDDPHADSDETKQEAGPSILYIDAMEPARAVVLVSSHQEYLEQGRRLITDILDDSVGTVFDVKARSPGDAIPDGIIHCRL